MVQKFFLSNRALVILFIIFIITCILFFLVSIPQNFPIGKNFIVSEDESLYSVSTRLKEGDYIHCASCFRLWVSLLGKDRHVQLGGYTFDKKTALGGVVKSLAIKGPDTPLIKITVPEGSTSYEVAKIVHDVLPNISIDLFGEEINMVKGDGKLFPSTYFLLPSTDEKRIVQIMLNTFEQKYEIFENKTIPKPLKNQEEVITLASILEGEAREVIDMQIVAGILLTRLSLGMALQVDVAKETYKAKGLPLQPVSNPGVRALSSVFNFKKYGYLYYITGSDGKMYYAKTFEEHKNNIKKHL